MVSMGYSMVGGPHGAPGIGSCGATLQVSALNKRHGSLGCWLWWRQRLAFPGDQPIQNGPSCLMRFLLRKPMPKPFVRGRWVLNMRFFQMEMDVCICLPKFSVKPGRNHLNRRYRAPHWSSAMRSRWRKTFERGQASLVWVEVQTWKQEPLSKKQQIVMHFATFHGFDMFWQRTVIDKGAPVTSL